MQLTDGRSIHAVANTGYDTTNDQVRKAVGASLQRSTDDHDDRTDKDGLAATKVVTNPDTEDGTTETAQVVRSGRDTWCSQYMVCRRELELDS